MLWYRLSVSVLVLVYFCTGGSMLQTVAIWVLVFWGSVLHTLGGWVGVYWGTVVHILCGCSSTDVLRYCGTNYLCLSGYWRTEVKVLLWYILYVAVWVLVYWGSGVTVVQTLCGWVLVYWSNGVTMVQICLAVWVLMYWGKVISVVQTLWLSTGVLEQWCYCGTDFVAVWVLVYWSSGGTKFVAEY